MSAFAVLPDPKPLFSTAVSAGGGSVGALGDDTRGIVWLSYTRGAELGALLDAHPGIEWVQLPWAGVDAFHDVFVAARPQLRWTSAKGAYAEPVAEHALALTLALLRSLPERARATSWGGKRGRTLHRARVVIVGAGGIAREFIRLLGVFDADITVVRRTTDPVEGARRTVTVDALPDVVADADVVVLAAAATGATAHLVDAALLERMPETAVLINVARGSLVDTDALVAALAAGSIGGAALDVTDPEPLPEVHPLWTEPRCLITPHSADTPEMTAPLLAARITENVRAFLSGEPLQGVVDVEAGY
ncbi:hydroxyacid dehydrogenase [Microbacteriaceae bacterium VKM Ac-2855]|nr:hydroxyacid dehydrogenase [Microbacteriaceae bacterium VKM Ac-2855]